MIIAVINDYTNERILLLIILRVMNNDNGDD